MGKYDVMADEQIHEATDAHDAVTASDRPHLGGLSLLRSVDFWLVFFMCFATPGAAMLYMTNVSFILESLGQQEFVTVHAILVPVGATMARVRVSFAFHYYLQLMFARCSCRPGLFLICC